MQSFAGRSFIVTGGASGIGLATVQRLLKLSASVHVLDRASVAPAVLNEYLHDDGPGPDTTTGQARAWFYPNVDVASRPAVAQAMKLITARTPSLSGLLNAAGVCPSGRWVNGVEPDDVWREVMSINVDGTWNVTTELLHHLATARKDRPAGGGDGDDEKEKVSIVNVGSTASLVGIPTMGAYTASKHAVVGLTRTWAREYAARGVRVNLVAPGLIRTPLGLRAVETKDERSETTKEFVAAIPMKRVGEPDEIAGPVVFLLGEDSSYITGQVIAVNGGSP